MENPIHGVQLEPEPVGNVGYEMKQHFFDTILFKVLLSCCLLTFMSCILCIAVIAALIYTSFVSLQTVTIVVQSSDTKYEWMVRTLPHPATHTGMGQGGLRGQVAPSRRHGHPLAAV